MDRLDELQALLAILDAGILAAAGRRLRRSAPAMTRALATLESRVGARLIERTTRRVEATEAGLALAQQARTLLAGYAGAVRDANPAQLRGLIRMTAPTTFGRRHVTPLVAAFLDAHPGVKVELVLADGNLDLVADGLDVAVRIGPLTAAGLTARRVGEVQRVVVASPAYLAARGAPVRPAELAEHDTLFFSIRPAPAEWRFREGPRSRVVRLAPRLLVNDGEAALAASRAGQGITRALSYQVDGDLAAGVLIRLLRAFEPPGLPVQLVMPGGQFTTPRVRSFLDHAAHSLRGLAVIRPPGPAAA